MYRLDAALRTSERRPATVIVDLGQRSAALEPGDRPGAENLLENLRGRAALTEIVLDDANNDLLLVYRAARAADAEGAGGILFRRHCAGDPCTGEQPSAVRSLASILYDSLRTDTPNTPLVAHVALALRAIVPGTPAPVDPVITRGGLASWQERRAVAYMEERLDQSFPVSAVADACGLSVNHFSRAFRRSMGKPPHRWLLDRRIERAQALLRSSDMSLADVALACGFAEQSHFTRVFTRTVGLPPGAWRRTAD
ncbi:helix-turn-helix domain-containing protein [Luteibacter sp. CQ10]|uniref:helix-turn-helix domain-containing protein n=1 Tax=Luteibacter sp. CQ10 TaxID=2805821 RepID=UPI0034A53B6F